uniref:TSA: Wollemia nobilis Ref_Wollemi_Transcript_21991_1084 transcribed RNA sequence n=1 Tax=Wollemia nobilis TaxID=56998 RepID=A0A0C9QMM4_9CONI
MGSLIGHVAASLILCTAGIRHLACSFSSYAKSPRQYTGKPWYLLGNRWKNVDLWILLLSLPIAAICQVLWFFTSQSLTNPAYRVAHLDQVAVLVGFWVTALALFLSRRTEILPVGEELVFFIEGIAFVVEWMALASKEGAGLEAKCYNLLGWVIVVCGSSCLVLACRPGIPGSLWAEVGLGGGLTLQGTWLLQSGLTLLTTLLMPQGCHRSSAHTVVQCVSAEEERRAVALLDLAFICHTLVVLILGIFLCWAVAHNHGLIFPKDGDYTPISAADTELDHIQMQPLPKFDIE